jgi:glycosyltransferase involved in cell wall biosynthesis
VPINVVSFSSTGGAGNVARTLVDGLSKIGLDAKLITVISSNLRANPLNNPSLTMSAARDQYLHKAPNWNSLISLSRDMHSLLDEKLTASELTIFRWMNGLLGERFLQDNPDVGNLVWGLDDMNPFTGVCHYSGSCRGFESGCSECPAVRKPFRAKVEINLERKINFAERHKPIYVAPTDWIHGEFQKSRLGQGRDSRKILNPLQSRFFESQEEVVSSSNQLNVLIVAANLDDQTKGVWDVIDSLDRFLDKPNVELKLIGRYSKKLSSSLPRAEFTGPLDSGSVMQQMREHDVLLVPSLFENAGTVVAEAASQGLPTIAREVGGMTEMTNYCETGYLFKSNDDLDDIFDSLSTKELYSKGLLANEWAQQLKPELIAAEYADAFLK